MSQNLLTEEKLLQGMTTQQYIDQIKVNKQPFEDIYGAVTISAKSLRRNGSPPAISSQNSRPASPAIF